MTNEEKAKAYDEALERVKNIKTGKCETTFIFTVGLFEYIFPELAESEDERIRKELIAVVNDLILPDEQQSRFVDWLEKQCQVKESPISQHEDKTCKESSNSLTGEVKPMFKVGDWIINRTDATIMQIVNNKDFYESIEISGQRRTDTYNYLERDFRLWTIQDAKDGDVLATPNKNIFIFKNIEGAAIYDYCGIYFGRFQSEESCVNGIIWGELPNDYHPATKEQRDTLKKAMADVGWKFDFKKKELKKIESETEIPFGAKDSELQEVTYYIPKGFHAEIDDDKVVIKKGKKPTAWSEEDENILTAIIYTVRNSGYKHCMCVSNETMLDWLKSLKDRYTWKPSEEQINALDSTLQYSLISHNSYKHLNSLFNYLKKLREE